MAFLGVLIAGFVTNMLFNEAEKSKNAETRLGSSLIKFFVVRIPTVFLICLFLAYNVPW